MPYIETAGQVWPGSLIKRAPLTPEQERARRHQDLLAELPKAQLAEDWERVDSIRAEMARMQDQVNAEAEARGREADARARDFLRANPSALVDAARSNEWKEVARLVRAYGEGDAWAERIRRDALEVAAASRFQAGIIGVKRNRLRDDVLLFDLQRGLP